MALKEESGEGMENTKWRNVRLISSGNYKPSSKGTVQHYYNNNTPLNNLTFLIPGFTKWLTESQHVRGDLSSDFKNKLSEMSHPQRIKGKCVDIAPPFLTSFLVLRQAWHG